VPLQLSQLVRHIPKASSAHVFENGHLVFDDVDVCTSDAAEDLFRLAKC
jgi:hypothetical protein